MFSNVWSENTALFERLMKSIPIHQNYTMALTKFSGGGGEYNTRGYIPLHQNSRLWLAWIVKHASQARGGGGGGMSHWGLYIIRVIKTRI